ncbi:hypothetical protein [Micromonospora sp. NPDC049301]|uniref:hypothetical protein n=1 Tax=Micromonospora sp. NPDC049301 TaxID=3155723 RepID=UPI0034237376
MTRRAGRVTRFALRLGLLVGGIVAVWGAHEIGTTAAAYAAEPPPAAPVEAAVDLLGGVLGPILGTSTPPPAREGTADATAPGIPPSGAAPSRTPARAESRPANQVTPPPAHPVQVGTPEAAADGVRRPATPPRGGRVLAPVVDVLRPVTEPIRAGVITPASEVLRPVTDPVRAIVLAPLVDALNPATQPLAPILSPVWRELEPLLTPLAPLPGSQAPVTDRPDPPTGPTATAPAPSASIGTVDDLVSDAGAGCCTGSVGELARPASGPALPSTSAARHSPTELSSPLVRPDLPYPPRPDMDSTPAMPAPGNSGPGHSGTVHGDPSDAPTATWAPPTMAGSRCHPTDGDSLPSHSERPGTRPA